MLRRLFRSRKDPDWSDWRDVLAVDEDDNLVESQERYDYNTLTRQQRCGDTVWTATLEQQREHVERERREMGL